MECGRGGHGDGFDVKKCHISFDQDGNVGRGNGPDEVALPQGAEGVVPRPHH